MTVSDRDVWMGLDAAAVPVFAYDPTSRTILFANAAASALYGHPHDDFLTLGVGDLYPADAKPDADGPLPSGICRQRRADGTLIDVDLVITPMPFRGREAMMVVAHDVTSFRAAERQHRADVEMLRIAGEAAGIGGWRVDLETGAVTWSQETCLIFGVPDGTMLDFETALGFFEGADRQRIEKAFARCIADGVAYDLDTRAHTADGRPLALRAIGQPIFDGSGRIVAAQGAVQDLSRLRSVERSLAESQRMMHDFAEAMPHVVWFAEPDGTIAYASERLKPPADKADSFDLSRDWLDLIHPDDREELTRRWTASVASGSDFSIEARLQRDPESGLRWHQITARPYRDASGTILRWFGLSTDIDDHRRAEAETQRLAERLGATLDSITDAFITLDHDWRLTYMNPEAERVLRQPAAALLGRNLWEAFPEARGSLFQTEYEAAVARRETRRLQAPYAPLSVWFDVSAYPSDEGLSIYFRDITAQRENEERLRLLQLAVARINDCVLITEAEPLSGEGPRILFVNEAFSKQTGYTAAEAIGRTPRILQGPDTDRAALARIRTALHAWQPVREELLNYRKDGTPFWIELDIVPLTRPDGHCTHWVAVQRDITERKAAEARSARHAAQLEQTVAALEDLNALTLRGPALLDAIMEQGARLAGATGAAVLAREGEAWSIRGATGSAQALAKGASTVMPMADAALATGRAQLAGVAASGLVLDPAEAGVVAAASIGANGPARVVLLIVARDAAALEPAVLNSLEIYAGAVGVLLQRHHVEDQLRQAQRLEAVGQLTGGIAHDFNNLLTIILGNAELLADSLSSDQQLRLLAEMTQTAAERGAELTSRLLAFSRRQALDPKATNVGVLLQGMDPLLRRSLGEQVELEVIHGGGLWPAMVDGPQLESALLNLSINARDAMPDGGRLTIETRNTHLDSSYAADHAEVQPGQYVMIAVSDTGTGMDGDTVARAFEPFFTTKPVGKGSGLGLSMVFGFIKQSQGHVKIYSEPGQGTTVRLYLPRAASADTGTEAEESGARQDGQEKILLVEDDDLVRNHVAGQLRDLGYRVVAVSNGADAIEALRQTSDFDLLFTDVVMPGGMNGRELAEMARVLRPALPVLFTSGYTENAIVHHGRLDPGVHLLAKPYRRRDLAAKLRLVLSTPEGGGRA